jgi:hypothetical protein
LRGKRVRGPDEKDEYKRRKREKPYGFHTSRRRLSEISRRDCSHKGGYQPSAISFQLFRAITERLDKGRKQGRAMLATK